MFDGSSTHPLEYLRNLYADSHHARTMRMRACMLTRSGGYSCVTMRERDRVLLDLDPSALACSQARRGRRGKQCASTVDRILPMRQHANRPYRILNKSARSANAVRRSVRGAEENKSRER